MIESPHKHFKLQRISLRKATFETAKDVETIEFDDQSFEVQTKRGYGWERLSSDVDGKLVEALKLEVGFGIRLFEPSQDETAGDGRTIYEIEAIYAVEFDIVDSSFEQDDLADFADRNGTHLVWPYWRLHVSQTLQAASLPQIAIPLLAPVHRRPTAAEVEHQARSDALKTD
ncbi:hypothetical protein ACFWZ1_12490 [Frateuria sp. GZRe14]|uniref:hypothetical protein n=1 Tax=Frateuria sp. GZRe14 TaxID=3351534 RepID=UPI003EDBD90A